LARAGLTRAGFTGAAALLRTAGLPRDFAAAADFPAAGFPGAAGFGAGSCAAARAALTFFLACLAAFLLALASFRARLSTALARRTCCFAVWARAAAWTASEWSRCAAAASFARFCVEADVATVRSRLKKWRGGELRPGDPGLSPGLPPSVLPGAPPSLMMIEVAARLKYAAALWQNAE
jgi:hypothetical protein